MGWLLQAKKKEMDAAQNEAFDRIAQRYKDADACMFYLLK